MPITKERHIAAVRAGLHISDEFIRHLRFIGDTLTSFANDDLSKEELIEKIIPLTIKPQSLIWEQTVLLEKQRTYWQANFQRAERAKKREARKRDLIPLSELRAIGRPSRAQYDGLDEISKEYDRTHPATYDERPLDTIKQELQLFLEESDLLRPFLASRIHRPFVSERPSDHFGKYVPFYCCSCRPDEPFGYTRRELIEHLEKSCALVVLEREDEDNLTEEAVGFAPPRPSAKSEEPSQ